jgi:hypothetical protein
MKIGFILICAAILFAPFMNQSTPRRLLLFGKGNQDFSTQLQWIAKDSAGITERELVIEQHDFKTAEALKFNIPSTKFTVLLIGKDGSEKYRANRPIEIKRLFALIDSMPMRKAEMKNKVDN